MATLGYKIMQKAWAHGDAARTQGKMEVAIICDHLADAADGTEKTFTHNQPADLNEALHRYLTRLTQVATDDAKTLGLSEQDTADLLDAVEDWITSI